MSNEIMLQTVKIKLSILIKTNEKKYLKYGLLASL